MQSNGAEKQANLIISLRQKRFFSVHILAPGSNHAKSETLQLPNSLTLVQGVPKKMSHSWEPKKLGTSYSETKHLLDLNLRQQGALMSTPCSQSLRPNRCVVSEYNFLGSQECNFFRATL